MDSSLAPVSEHAPEPADDELLLTPAEAESLLEDGDTVHNFVANGMMIGCDYSRAEAIKAFGVARRLEIGGPGCKAMGHAIAATEHNGRVSFFAADREKVEVFEAAKVAAETVQP